MSTRQWAIGDRIVESKVLREGDSLKVEAEGEHAAFHLEAIEGTRIVLRRGDAFITVHAVREGERTLCVMGGRTYELKAVQERAVRGASDESEAEIASPMAGKVVRVACAVGAVVDEGGLLVVVEAMKMEYQLKAPFRGKVERLAAADGASVGHGEVLVHLVREVKAQ